LSYKKEFNKFWELFQAIRVKRKRTTTPPPPMQIFLRKKRRKRVAREVN